MIEFVGYASIALLIWTVLAILVDSHKESKREYIQTETGLPTFERTEPPGLSTAGQIAVLPFTVCLKIVSVLGVVWNRVLYNNQEENTELELKREFLREKAEENEEYWSNKKRRRTE